MSHPTFSLSRIATGALLCLAFATPAHSDPTVDWGGALLFDGGQLAQTPLAAALPVGNAAYTQEFWLRLDALPSYGGYNGFILSRGDEGYLVGNHVVAVNGNVGLTHWGLDRDTGVPLPLGSWHHVAATWDGSTESLYLDGQLKWAQAAPALAVAGGSLTFGSHDNVGNYHLFGALDEVRIWSVARTATQIQASFAQTVASDSAGLVGYWKFDEAGGQMLLDSSPYAQHMTLGGSDAVAPDDPWRIASGVVGAVPEPASWMLLLGGGLLLGRRLRQRP